MSRDKTTRRLEIAKGICRRLNKIDGTGAWKTDLSGNNCDHRMRFIDEIHSYPYVCVVPGPETREYQGAGFKWRFLEITLTIFSNAGDQCQEELEWLLEDIETQLDTADTMEYFDASINGNNQITDLRILSMSTDQGAFADDGFAIGEMVIEVRY